jgi:uncharacterized protein
LIVVSDTSPILNLSAVGQLSLLRQLYSEIIVPPAVQSELLRSGVQLEYSWVSTVAACDRDAVAVLRAELDPGEAEAIVVASEIHAGLLLVDEKR